MTIDAKSAREFTDAQLAAFAKPTWVNSVAEVPLDEMALMVAEDPSVMTTLIGALRHARQEVARLSMEWRCSQIQVEDRGNSYQEMRAERDGWESTARELAARLEREGQICGWCRQPFDAVPRGSAPTSAMQDHVQACASNPLVQERDSLRSQLAASEAARVDAENKLRVTLELEDAQAETVALNVERDTAEAIAVWLSKLDILVYGGWTKSDLPYLLKAIRSGAWRPSAGEGDK